MGGIRPRVDTRTKILSEPAAWPAFARPLVLVTGYFDILRAADVRELTALRGRAGGGTLLVLVLAHPGELSPPSDRAQLVAAMRMVDYVLTADPEDLDRLIGSLRPQERVSLEAGEARRTRQLIEHVHRRQTC